MLIKEIYLKWFRGAAAGTSLQLGGKSTVVYGPNGSGKSSFVDAVEVCISGGKVAHLTSEYSDRNQLNGLVNVQRPVDEKSTVKLVLGDASEITAVWASAAPAFVKTGPTDPQDLDCSRVALRQAELSDFIKCTKGERYSAVLPLLGLGAMQNAAENLRKLKGEAERANDYPQKRRDLYSLIGERERVFPGMDHVGIKARVDELILTFSLSASSLSDARDAIRAKMSSLDASSRTGIRLREIKNSTLLASFVEWKSAVVQVSAFTEPLIKERISTLEAVGHFRDKLAPDTLHVSCPACGVSVSVDDLSAHISRERERLTQVALVYRRYHEIINEISSRLNLFCNELNHADLNNWLAQGGSEYRKTVEAINSAKLALSSEFDGSIYYNLELDISKVISLAEADLPSYAAQSADALTAAKEQIDLAIRLQNLPELQNSIQQQEVVISLLAALENEVRSQISVIAKIRFNQLSEKIQKFWSILRPHDKIEGIQLHVPTTSDKAIEIHLVFFGKQQPTPRLTLSEGQRNALGLAIFLALATEGYGGAIILDDVVLSLDRDHRSNVVELFKSELSDRQLIVLTHEREWFFELQRLLPSWNFVQLSEYVDPSMGINILNSSTDIAAARLAADSDPANAISQVRRILDVGLAKIAEEIGLSLPYRRGHANDHRTAGEYLLQLEKQAPGQLRIRQGESEYIQYEGAIGLIRKVKPENEVWSNRGVHTFSVSRSEAITLIGDVEQLLKAFHCDGCNNALGTIKSNSRCECRCGKLRWKHL